MTELSEEGGAKPEKQNEHPENGAAEPAGEVWSVRSAPCGEELSAEHFVIGVLTEPGGKVGDYYWNGLNLKVGDLCVVEEEGGEKFLGTVALAKRPAGLGGCCGRGPGRIVRRATKEDEEKAAFLARKEKAAMAHCREKIVELDIPMSLSRVHYTFDGKKAVFFFTADGRVDFRELVREMVNYTRVKVEMRQIGVRDEARIMGGCGPCGHELCCATFLADFAPVSIRMAKDQNLSLNPAKISGVCGRLMCCLGYEHDSYRKLMGQAPKMGKSAITPDGRIGKVLQLNLLKERVVVMFEDESKAEFSLSEVAPARGGKPQKKAGEGAGGRPREAQAAAPAEIREPVERTGGKESPAEAERGGTRRKRRKRRGSGKREPQAGPAPGSKQEQRLSGAAGEPGGRGGEGAEKTGRSSARRRRSGFRKKKRGPSGGEKTS